MNTDPVFHVSKAYVYTYVTDYPVYNTKRSVLYIEGTASCASGSAFRLDAASAVQGVARGTYQNDYTGDGSENNCYQNYGFATSMTPSPGSVNFVDGGPVSVALTFRTFPYGQEDSPFIKTWTVSATLPKVCTYTDNATGLCPAA